MTGTKTKPYRMKDFGADRCGITPLYLSSNGKRVKFHSYTAWMGIFQRCYSPKYHALIPTYIGCSVSDEWKRYDNFIKWHDKNYIEGYQLDKDLLIKGNKVYGPQFCRYIPSHINSLLNNCGSRRGKFPQGVSFFHGMYKSELKKRCKSVYLGLFKTPEEAYAVYKIEKELYVKEQAELSFNKHEIDVDIYNALVMWELD